VTPALSVPLRGARDALQANPPKLQEAVAKLKEAGANPKKTPYDEHIINALAGYAYTRLNDWPDAEKAFAAEVDDGFTRPADFPRIVKAAAQINYQLKNYARAAEFGNRAPCVQLQDSGCINGYNKRLNAPRQPILIDPELKHGEMLQANSSSQ
jgi:hypothetical protein